MKKYRAELHVHTVLSPCASVEMIPPLIIAEAETKRISIVAITDHNSIGNIHAVIEASKNSSVHIVPGIELQTREEIHSICLFDTLDNVQSFFDRIESTFPDIHNNSEFFGEQFIVDKTGDFIRRENRLLIASSSLSLTDAFNEVEMSGGLLIPAHVNRSAYGLLPVLGVIPEDIDIPILEISKHITPGEAVIQFPQLSNYKLIQNGDAHSLNEIMGFNELLMENVSVKEIKLALLGHNNRSSRNLFSSIIN